MDLWFEMCTEMGIVGLQWSLCHGTPVEVEKFVWDLNPPFISCRCKILGTCSNCHGTANRTISSVKLGNFY